MGIEYEGDAFISYAHLDNVELDEGRGGWVTNLQRALEARVAQLYGAELRVDARSGEVQASVRHRDLIVLRADLDARVLRRAANPFEV
jgi:hypothetical protein